MTIEELVEFLQQLPQDMEVYKIENQEGKDESIIPLEEEDLAELNLSLSEEDIECGVIEQKVLIINFESTK